MSLRKESSGLSEVAGRSDLHSFIVSFYGLEGIRQHWMPGNRRKGLGPREKKSYANEAEARDGLEEGGTAYQCDICGAWHRASRKRRS